MEKPKRERTDRINWFLDFVQKDLTKLPPGDRAKLCFEAENIMIDRSIMEEAIEDDITQMEGHMTEDQKQGIIKIETIPGLNNLEEYFNMLQEVQPTLLDYIHDCLFNIVSEKKEYSHANFGEGPSRLVVKPDPKSKKILVAFRPETLFFDVPNNLANIAFHKFAYLISDLPTEWLRTCAEFNCCNFFFYPYKREKKFCSQECSWRYFARQRRESNPEAYKEYQRKIMAKRYRKEHPKAKIMERRRRYKPGDEIDKK